MGMLPYYLGSGTVLFAGMVEFDFVSNICFSHENIFSISVFSRISGSCKDLSFWVAYCRSEQGLELDLLLLQCCAALAPADLYVSRILERFGLSSYLSLNPERSSEYVSCVSIFFLGVICCPSSFFVEHIAC